MTPEQQLQFFQSMISSLQQPASGQLPVNQPLPAAPVPGIPGNPLATWLTNPVAQMLLLQNSQNYLNSNLPSPASAPSSDSISSPGSANTSLSSLNDSGFGSPASSSASPATTISPTAWNSLAPLMQQLLIQAGTGAAGVLQSPVQSQKQKPLPPSRKMKISPSTSNGLLRSLLPSLDGPNTPVLVARKKCRKDYCKVCQAHIFKEGVRSQGPRRHILQHHLKKNIFLCPICPFGSDYDKAHVHAHIKRMHPGSTEVSVEMPRHVYQVEEDLWMQTCFGASSDGSVPVVLAEMMKVDKETEGRRYLAEMRNHREQGKVDHPAATTFSISDLINSGEKSEEKVSQDDSLMVDEEIDVENVSPSSPMELLHSLMASQTQ